MPGRPGRNVSRPQSALTTLWPTRFRRGRSTHKRHRATETENLIVTGKQVHIASRIDAAMQALTQTSEDDMAVLAGME